MSDLADVDVETSFIAFGEEVLGLKLYDWQCEVVEPFDYASERMVQVSLSTPNGSGKAQPRDEPVWTPQGWRAIGELMPGDSIFTADGSPTTVAAVHPRGVLPVFAVRFDDGSMTRCCGEHLWRVQSCYQRNDDKSSKAGVNPGRWEGHERWSVLPLHEVEKRKRLHRYIPISEPAQMPERTFEIDPYTMGVLLGDGCLQPGSASVCTRHDTLANCVWPHGVELRLNDERGVVSSWRIADARRVGTESVFLMTLREMGIAEKRSWEKFIPREYFLGSPEQRIALLRGLMDTDGTMGQKKTASPEFNSTSPMLAQGVIELVRSLGGIATMTTRTPHFTYKGVRKPGRTDHRVRMSLPVCPFKVERKAARWSAARSYGPRRIMETITPDGEADCVCITVEHSSGLYVTRDHIVTHNSALCIPVLILGWLAMYPKGRVCLTSADGKQLDGQLMPALESHRSKFPEWKFIEREIVTPTGGRFVAFSTSEPGRAEGWHKLNDEEGPLLFIVDEAKSVGEDIFTAIDRCTYNAILLASSPGKMSGRFYNTQFKPELNYNRIAIGLKDCPHIGQDKIDRIIQMHGPNSPFTRSALHGEFIELFDGDPVYYAYSQQVHEFDTLGWPHGALLIVGMDVGTHNASVIAAFKTDSAGRPHLWVMREIILTGSDTDRQCVELLKVLATEFPFWNTGTQVCPQTLFYCDPAARNSAFTSRGPNASALKVIQSHGIFPGMKTAVHLQPSIAVVNRLLQQNFTTANGGVVWQFRIDKGKCPQLVRGMAGGYRYASVGQPTYGSDLPLKGALCDNLDHPCFVSGTMIQAQRGEIPIERIRIGDLVETRNGLRRVAAWAKTHEDAAIWRIEADGQTLFGTQDHPIWVENYGWKPLAQCLEGDRVLVWNTSNLKESHIHAAQTQRIRGDKSILPMAAIRCIGRFGSIITARFLSIGKFTIGMKTRPIMISQTSNASPQESISRNIGGGEKRIQKPTFAGIAERISKALRCIRSIFAQAPAKPVTASGDRWISFTDRASIAGSIFSGTNTNSGSGYVSRAHTKDGGLKSPRQSTVAQGHAVVAEKNLHHISSPAGVWHSAPNYARRETGEIERSIGSTKYAPYAERPFHPTRLTLKSIALEAAPIKQDGRAAVFNITVEGEHEYFANGLLVSNCDAFRYLTINALDIATEPHTGSMRTPRDESRFTEPQRRV